MTKTSVPTEKGEPMARLIDMDYTMDKLRAYADRKHEAGHTELANGILKAVNYIHNEVSRVDAVEVVRCKDCRYCQRDSNGMWCFNDYEHNLQPDDYCSYGERRTDNA